MTTAARTVFRTEWFAVEEERFDLASLRGKPHYRINSPDGIIVLTLTERDEVILIRQFRPALRTFTLELPSGAVDPAEPPEVAARRELYEETGYVPRSLVAVGAGRLKMERHTCRDHMFFATDAVRDPSFIAREEIDVVPVSRTEFKRLVLAGEFEQLAALALVLLLDWTIGRPLVDGARARQALEGR